MAESDERQKRHVITAAQAGPSLAFSTDADWALSDLHESTGDYASALRHAEAVARRESAPAGAHLRVGELLLSIGRADEARASLRRSLDLAQSTGDRSAEAATFASLAELDYQRGHYRCAREKAQRASKNREASAATQLRARNVIGKITLFRAPRRAATLFGANVRRAAEAALPAEQAQALTNLGIAHLRAGELRAAEQTFRTALRVAEGTTSLREKAIATENLAVLAHLERNFAEALRRYHDALSLLRQLGNRPMLARVATNLGELYLALNDQTRSAALAEFAGQLGGFGLEPVALAEVLLLRGRVSLRLGQLSDARTAFTAAADRYRDVGDSNREVAVAELARVEIASGNFARAKSLISELTYNRSAKRNAEIDLLSSDILRAQGAGGAARSAHALAEADESGDPLLRLRATITHAENLIDSGRRDLATALFRTGIDLDGALSARIPPSAVDAWEKRPLRVRLQKLAERVGATTTDSSLEKAQASSRFPRIVGTSQAMTDLRETIARVAPTTASVLVVGESGTGKGLVAEALHELSPRRHGPFVKIHCGALVESLLLSELFGHERGSFTGACTRKHGRFELAHGGTLFLDEIGDISLSSQAALLRVLEERRFFRVGGTRSISTDIRFVAATHRDLGAMVREGTFREDLYYRLRGVRIETPPLRRRIEDLRDLTGYLLLRAAREQNMNAGSLSAAALQALASHSWPGNVRELDNALRSAALLSDRRILEVSDFPFLAADHADGESPEPPRNVEDVVYHHLRGASRSLPEVKKELERECIVRALSESGGNITRAATLLGMKRPRLSQLVKQHRLLSPEPGDSDSTQPENV